MSRLNLTLDKATATALERHARKDRQPRASLARELIREAMSLRETRERQRRLSADYAAERADSKIALSELEAGQLDLLEEP